MNVLNIPAPTIAEGAPFLVLWAEFTGRTPVEREAVPCAVEGPSGRYMPVHL